MKLSQALATLLAIYSFVGGRVAFASFPNTGFKMMAYQAGWRSCYDSTNTPFTHLIVGFQGTYTGCKDCQEYKCSTDCTIPEMKPLCNLGSDVNMMMDSANAKTQVEKWQEDGLKVLLSVGGDGQNKCWDSSKDNTESSCTASNAGNLATAIVNLVTKQGFDGVDVNFEPEANDDNMAFLVEFTRLLRTQLLPEKIITHAPPDSKVEKGTLYFNNLKNIKDNINFLLPQFYNGVANLQANGFDGKAQTLFTDLQGTSDEKLFDAKQLVIGVCNGDGCDGHGLPDPTSTPHSVVTIVDQLNAFACPNGGIFLYSLVLDAGTNFDANGWGNAAKTGHLDTCTTADPVVPTAAPITLAPTTLAPTTLAPTTLTPTTLAPTTLAPTTLAPTTLAPSPAPVPIRDVKIKKSKAKNPVIKAERPAISKAKSLKSSKAKSPKTSASKGRLFQTGNTNFNQVLTTDQLQNICSNYCVNQAAGVASSVTISGSSSHVSSTATSVSSKTTTVATTSGTYSG